MNRGDSLWGVLLGAIIGGIIGALLIIGITTKDAGKADAAPSEPASSEQVEVEEGEPPADAKEVEEVEVEGQEGKTCHRWLQLIPMRVGGFTTFMHLWHTSCH